MADVGVSANARPGMLGFDSLALFPLDVLKAARAAGFEWTGAYLEAMTPRFVDDCFEAGLCILPICEARISALSADVGKGDATRELARCAALSMPSRVGTTIDFEDAHGTVADCTGYLQTFASGLVDGGKDAVLYVAPPQPLTAAELYLEQPDIHLYFHGGGVVPEVPCGYSVFQGLPLEYVPAWSGGRKVDLDVIFADRRGRTPRLWCPS